MTTALPTTSAEQKQELHRLLGPSRLSPFEALAAQVETAGVTCFDFYVHNMALASSLLGPLHILEVVTRHAYHVQLQELAGCDTWWDVLPLTPIDKSRIEKARKKIESANRASDRVASVGAGDLISSTDFGLWCSLVGRGDASRGVRYEDTLWRAGLRDGFPHFRGGRQRLWSLLNRIRILRNRVAHHERLPRDDEVLADYAYIVQVTGFISPDIAQWVGARARVSQVVSRPPGSSDAIALF